MAYFNIYLRLKIIIFSHGNGKRIKISLLLFPNSETASKDFLALLYVTLTHLNAEFFGHCYLPEINIF